MTGKGWHSRGYLPHFDKPGLVQNVTFHLADSLPRDVVIRMQRNLDLLPEPGRDAARRQAVQDLLDRGMGACLLRRPDCARIVEDSLRHGDGPRYRLLAWTVMPNHVHVMIEQGPDWPLPKVVQSWKRHTSRQIHRTLGAPSLGAPSCTRPPQPPLWQRDYWDRYIRDRNHYVTAKRYIDMNPVKAGLVERAEAWPWGSARFEDD